MNRSALLQIALMTKRAGGVGSAVLSGAEKVAPRAARAGRSWFGRLARKTTRNPHPIKRNLWRLGKWTAGTTAVGAGMGGGMAMLTGRQRMGQMGEDAAYAVIDRQLRDMKPWQRQLVAMDPSVAVAFLNHKSPGVAQQIIEAKPGFQYGMLGNMMNKFYEDDAGSQWTYSTPDGKQHFIT